jgi:hypothetical protein
MAIVMLAFSGCKPTDNADQTLPGYDLAKPEKFFMPESLHEISGISFHKSNKDTIYAIQDEEGKLFRLAWDIKKQYHSKFGKKGDYEDLAIVQEKVVVLKSNGSFYTFPFSETVDDELDSVREWKHLLPLGEYESLYGDEQSGKLYLLCKNCPADTSLDIVSGYIIQSGDSMYRTGTFQLNIHDFSAFSGKVKKGFRASALTKNIITNEWYILSAINKMLVVTDSSWKIKRVCRLNPKIFNQPEGITLDSQGTLYISNEGDDFAEGTILKFARKAE